MRVKPSTEYLPRFPIYVHAKKGRPLTATTLEGMGIPCRVVATKNQAKQDSLKEGNLRHWIFDGDVENFCILFRNKIIDCFCPSMFHIMETIVLNYTNVGLASPTVFPVSVKKKYPFFKAKAICSSCILVNNMMDCEWEGENNDEEILYIKALSENFSTMVFPYFGISKSKSKTNGTSKKGFCAEHLSKTKRDLDFLMSKYPRYFSTVRKIEGWEYVVNTRMINRDFGHVRLIDELPGNMQFENFQFENFRYGVIEKLQRKFGRL